MGLSDRIADKSFIKLEDGRTAFYPNGVFTRGYVVTDPGRIPALHAAMKRFGRKILILLAIMLVPFALSTTLIQSHGLLDIPFVVFIVLFWIIWSRWQFRDLIRGLLKTEKRLSFRVFTLQHGVSAWVSFIYMSIAIIVFLFSIFYLFSGVDLLSQLELTVISGFLVAVFGYVFWLKLGARRNRPNA